MEGEFALPETLREVLYQKVKELVELKPKLEEIINNYKGDYNSPEYIQMLRKYTEVSEIYNIYSELIKESKEIEAIRIAIKEASPEEKIVLQEIENNIKNKNLQLEKDLLIKIVPQDEEDLRPAIVEIRAGTGGDESALIVGDLFRAYSKFCDKKKWDYEVIDYLKGNVGGYKYIFFKINAEGSYGELKFESGVHRVQRIPKTESHGRIHTSAVSVVVLPIPDEVKIQIREEDIKREAFGASGPGGQHVNKTASAVRLTHIPTGIVVTCQDERSQHQNYKKALEILKAKLYQIEMDKKLQAIASKRKTYIQTGDRSVKVRTYNFPQNRVTDHRINLVLYNLDEILEGNFTPIINAFKTAEAIEKLKEISNVPQLQ